MSAEHQQYSTENQSDVLRAYALKHGMSIVRTYRDGGKSGLVADNRNSLQRLIGDAQGAERGFDVILVYDVTGPGQDSRVALLIGTGVVLLVRALGSRYLWWSLHPAGYALAAAQATNNFWLPIILGWLAKLLLIRYGGLRSHRAAIPFFLGLILGDCVTYSAWAGIRGLLGARGITVWWVA